MTKHKRRKNFHRSGNKLKAPGPLPVLDEDSKNKKFELCAAAILLAFGVYQSILYFGHQVVPNSDFPSFVGVARTILRFEIPASFKRLPGLGILQIGLSKFISGSHPVLTAGWLLNAICHPLSIVLLYLIGKRVLGKSALGFALIIAVNPWVVSMLAQPMAETTLLFFTLLTFYLILRRTHWCYLAACLASVIRYDAIVLVMVAFLVNIVIHKTKRERIQVIIWAFLASIPLALWMLGTKINWETSSKSDYFGLFISSRHVGLAFFDLLWQSTFQPLLQIPSWLKAILVQAPTAAQKASIQSANDILFGLSKTMAVIGIAAGSVYALVKKQWQAIALFLFFAITAAVHTRRAVSTQRYTFPLIWITLLLCCYGWRNIFRLIDHKEKIPRPVIIAFQSIIALIATVWLIRLVPLLSKVAPYSRRSVWLPFVTIGVVVLLFLSHSFVYRRRHVLRFLVLSALVCLMVVSNQFTLARMVGNGNLDAEFKQLADWYVQNAQPGENLVTSMPNVVRLFAPQHSKHFIPTSRIKADDPAGFVQACYKRGVAYVAWDSRIGLTPNNSYYKKWGISRIAMLGKPQSIGPYEFVTQLKQNDRKYINIFKLHTNPPGF